MQQKKQLLAGKGVSSRHRDKGRTRCRLRSSCWQVKEFEAGKETREGPGAGKGVVTGR